MADDPALPAAHRAAIDADEDRGVSIISCWEVAMLVALKRLELTIPVLHWIEEALRYPGVRLLGLTPGVVVDSTVLPGGFHRDPADRMLVATARALGCAILTSDDRILGYSQVRSVGPSGSVRS